MGMNEELPPVTKLTRYAIRFDLAANQVGTILGLFVGQKSLSGVRGRSLMKTRWRSKEIPEWL